MEEQTFKIATAIVVVLFFLFGGISALANAMGKPNFSEKTGKIAALFAGIGALICIGAYSQGY